MKVKTTKEKKVREYFRGTEVGMMIEVLQDQMKMVAENLSGFRKKAEERLEKIEKNSEVTLEYLFKIDDRLSEIETELSEIKADLRKIDESKADKKDFEAVKARIFDCENRLKFMEKQLKASGA